MHRKKKALFAGCFQVNTRDSQQWNRRDGLCLIQNRFAYPLRYFHLLSTFAPPIPELCMISNTLRDWIQNVHGFRLTSQNQPFLSPAKLQKYTNAIVLLMVRFALFAVLVVICCAQLCFLVFSCVFLSLVVFCFVVLL